MPQSRVQGLRIGQLAAEFGLNPKTIRYYEQIGLLPAPRRTAAGYRVYGRADRERLGFILKAKAIGLTLDEIAELLALRQCGEAPCPHVRDLIARKLTAVDEQLRALVAFRGELARLSDEAANAAHDDPDFCAIIERHGPVLAARRG